MQCILITHLPFENRIPLPKLRGDVDPFIREYAMKDDELMTIGQVARAAGISPTAVRWHVDQGRLPVLRALGGLRLFYRDDVDRFLAERDALRHARHIA
jgi:excisionase family DNA binding protein